MNTELRADPYTHASRVAFALHIRMEARTRGHIMANANSSDASIGFEEKLWAAADKMRGHMDASEYKHVVLGLIFLKYISDAFEECKAAILSQPDALPDDAEDRDFYTSKNVFWVPTEARWSVIAGKARSAEIGQTVDAAMNAIERDNPKLKGVLQKDYARPTLDKTRLGELVDLIGNITVGDAASRSKDVLGRVYEYFLGKFASSEGKGGGEFYTPSSVVRLLVEMIEPLHGRVYDPCCGSGGMFVQSERFVEAYGGSRTDLSVFGQESNPTTWRLARMNLAIRSIEGDLGPHHADSFHNDVHKDLKADYILANPPFNISDWGGERLREDRRWQYGAPPVGNANFGWVQHFVHHLAPNGIAGFVLANGSMSSNTSGEGDIRQALIEGDLVDCMIALPGQLFYTTPIPVCLWFLHRNKQGNGLRNRQGETLFIDARKSGHLVNRTLREFSDEDIERIAGTYHAWRGEQDAGTYEDEAGFCRSADLDELRHHGYVLTPGRYVGTEAEADDGEPFAEKMQRLTDDLFAQFDEGQVLEERIRNNLSAL